MLPHATPRRSLYTAIPPSPKRACTAGWAAVDPADVAKVMRQETPEWIKSAKNEVIVPVYDGLFGNWEGNWMAYNTAHDVALPGSKAAILPFLMYPQAEVKGERVDTYDPETFKYSITAREVPA